MTGFRIGAAPGRERGRWLQPPRLRTAETEEEHRRATWLELFFDVVFVVAVAELSHQLVVDHSADGFLRFAGLFVPVWVAWQGYMAYADRFDTDDLGFRVALFVAMLAIAALAVLLGDVAHGEHTAGFAVSYVVLRSVMLVLYARAWRAVPEARPLIRRYGSGYSIAVAAWLASLAVQPPARYVVWGLAIALELSLPPLSIRLHRRVPTSGSHLPERWALFTLIVLGESVVAVALETAGTNWRFVSAVAAVLGFAAVAAVWWLYFDRADVVLGGDSPAPVVYSYAHLPLLIGLAALSSGIRLLIDRAGEPHLGAGPAAALLGGPMLFLASLVAMRSVTVAGTHRVGIALKVLLAAVLVVLLGAQSVLPPVAIAAVLASGLAGLVVAERLLLGAPE
jgi:low temperature requirement protein LtrA